MKMYRLISNVVAGVILAGVSAQALADADSDGSIVQLIENFADKPSDHAALAKYYQDQVVDAENTANAHKKMRMNYQAGGGKTDSARIGMRSHCDKLVKTYESLAKEYRQMATEHERMAGGAKK